MTAPPRVEGRLATLVTLAVVVAALHSVVLQRMASPMTGKGADGAGITRIDLAVAGQMGLSEPQAAGLATVSALSAMPSGPEAGESQAVPVPASPASAPGAAPPRPPRPAAVLREPATPPGQDDAINAHPKAAVPSEAALDPPSQGPTALAQAAPPNDASSSASATSAPQIAAPPASVSASAPVPTSPVAGSDPNAPPFEWPPSTRLSYVLTGNFRGEVHGSARVEWVRERDRYQVHLDVTVGPRLTPLMTRRMSSEGTLGPEGLQPLRYEEETRIAFREPRRVTMRLAREQVSLADGRNMSVRGAVQDTASQFIQLAYQFAVQPSLLQPGTQVPLLLALPRRVDTWTYDVVSAETLQTGLGPIEAHHLKPRPIERPGDTLTAEAWFAPRLRYLPVRIRIQQQDDVFIDLLIERLPDVLMSSEAKDSAPAVRWR